MAGDPKERLDLYCPKGSLPWERKLGKRYPQLSEVPTAVRGSREEMKTPGPHLSLEYSEAGMWAAALSRAVGGVFQGTVNNEGVGAGWQVECGACCRKEDALCGRGRVSAAHSLTFRM